MVKDHFSLSIMNIYATCYILPLFSLLIFLNLEMSTAMLLLVTAEGNTTMELSSHRNNKKPFKHEKERNTNMLLHRQIR